MGLSFGVEAEIISSLHGEGGGVGPLAEGLVTLEVDGAVFPDGGGAHGGGADLVAGAELEVEEGLGGGGGAEEQEEGGEEEAEGFHGIGVGGVRTESGVGMAAKSARRRKKGGRLLSPALSPFVPHGAWEGWDWRRDAAGTRRRGRLRYGERTRPRVPFSPPARKTWGHERVRT